MKEALDTGANETGCENTNRPSNRHALLRDLLIGLIATGTLVLGMRIFEHTSVAHRVKLLTYEFLHRWLSPFDPTEEMPIVVLDTSSLPGGKDGATSREHLSELIDALLRTEPRGIAIDMNFSPDRISDWKSPDDPEFFNSLLEKRATWNVPIFVGVSKEKTGFGGADLWLGSSRYQELAALMDIDDDDTTRLPYSVKCSNEEIYSFSAAMVRFSQEKHQPPKFFMPALKTTIPPEAAEQCNETCFCTYTLVNYAKLEILQAQSLPIVRPEAIKDAEHKFRGKFVILGDGTLGRSQDAFGIQGRKRPVPGVYLHAAAMFTLVREPLYELKQNASLLIDCLIGFSIILIVTVIRWRELRRAQLSHRRFERLFLWLAVAVVLAFGILMIQWFHIIWLDSALVIFALLLHPTVAGSFNQILNYISTVFSKLPRPT